MNNEEEKLLSSGSLHSIMWGHGNRVAVRQCAPVPAPWRTGRGKKAGWRLSPEEEPSESGAEGLQHEPSSRGGDVNKVGSAKRWVCGLEGGPGRARREKKPQRPVRQGRERPEHQAEEAGGITDGSGQAKADPFLRLDNSEHVSFWADSVPSGLRLGCCLHMCFRTLDLLFSMSFPTIASKNTLSHPGVKQDGKIRPYQQQQDLELNEQVKSVLPWEHPYPGNGRWRSPRTGHILPSWPGLKREGGIIVSRSLQSLFSLAASTLSTWPLSTGLPTNTEFWHDPLEIKEKSLKQLQENLPLNHTADLHMVRKTGISKYFLNL